MPSNPEQYPEDEMLRSFYEGMNEIMGKPTPFPRSEVPQPVDQEPYRSGSYRYEEPDPEPVTAEIPRYVDDEMVDHPKHYNMYRGVEVIDLVEQMPFNTGNAVKYLTRAPFKGRELEDLEKAVWYTQREIDRLRNRP